MNQTFLKHKSYFLYNELARRQIYKRWVLLGKSITYKCLLCQSVFCRVLNGVSDSVFKFKKSFKKDTEKVVLLQMKGLMQIIVKFSTDFFFVCVCVCMFLSQNINWTFIFPWRVINWYVLQIASLISGSLKKVHKKNLYQDFHFFLTLNCLLME